MDVIVSESSVLTDHDTVTLNDIYTEGCNPLHGIGIIKVSFAQDPNAHTFSRHAFFVPCLAHSS